MEHVLRVKLLQASVINFTCQLNVNSADTIKAHLVKILVNRTSDPRSNRIRFDDRQRRNGVDITGTI